MKRILIITFFLAFSIQGIFSQTLLKIGEQEISRDEFERIYKKNNTQLSDESEIKSPKEYLDMFVNFKLKVIEAENRGMDTIHSFVSELEGYRNELAKPYLTDVSVADSIVKSTFKRTLNEVKASHILIRITNSASEEEKQAALEKITTIRNNIINSDTTFKEMAKKYSEDPSVQRNSGSLGYFSAFQMVTPFENTAFNTPVGEISEPIQTSFGYHIIKVDDKRKAKGEIKVAHIMKMFQRNASKSDVDSLKVVADSLYNLVSNGENFAKIAEKHSDDQRSSGNGGEMAWINSSFNVTEFVDAAYQLKNKGDISEVIRTDYGWHIIKLIDTRPLPTFEEKKAEIEQKVKSDPQRSKYSKIRFIEKRKSEYGFDKKDENYQALKDFLNNQENDTITIESITPITEKTLFILGDSVLTIKNYIDQISIKDSIVLKNRIFKDLDKFESDVITTYEDNRLEDKYPDFKYLLQEYHDGILLFNIMEKEVWNKAVEDTLGLENFYKQNIGKYKFGEHFDGLIVECESQAYRDSVEITLSEGIKVPEEIEMIYNNDENENIKVDKGRWEKGDNKIVDYFVWNSDKPNKLNELLTFVYGDKKDSADKTLDEARGLYISDYQDYLEKEWLKTLKEKYKIKVKKRELRKVEDLQ